ncbi:hypothetical protein, partial [Stenotrophomonas maltophilia]|uniref:hypothetical protein n=1 Tax=Stenotrophomonas maltophilia TaxID=40324 RepID=UPI001C8BED39
MTQPTKLLLLLIFFFFSVGERARKLSEGGRGGFAGHAVNPSLGARWRHPHGANGPANPPRPPSDSFRARSPTEKKKKIK